VHALPRIRPALGRRSGIAPGSLASPTAKGALFVLAAALAFSTLGSLSGLAYRAGMGSATFVTVRAVVGATLLLLVIAGRHQPWVRIRGLPRHEMAMLGAAVVANAVLNLALFAAYGQMAVALVLAVYFTYPMLVAVASVVIGRERFTRARTVGLATAAVGLALVMAERVGGASLAPLGLVWALVAATCQATYLVVSRAGYTRVPAEQATALMLGGGAVRLLGGTRTAVLMLFEPIAAVALAAVVLDQAVTPMQAAGGLVLLGAARLVQRPAPGAGAAVTPG
jgi:drug/metabolite transporter (DMT)-like permease